MQLNEAIQSRKSVRKFTDKKPDWRDIIECIDATRYAPMAANNFTPRFIIVEDESTIQKLADAAQQKSISNAKIVVIALSNPTKTTNSFKDMGEIYVRQQAGAAIENFLLKIQEKGLATCWVGHFAENLVKDALKIPEKLQVEALLPLGYELSGGERKPQKIDINQILFFERYGNKKMKNPKGIDV